jgi:hypothetical protein
MAMAPGAAAEERLNGRGGESLVDTATTLIMATRELG